jgi:hypothetical protein
MDVDTYFQVVDPFKKIKRHKHSSLLSFADSDKEKSLRKLTPGQETERKRKKAS